MLQQGGWRRHATRTDENKDELTLSIKHCTRIVLRVHAWYAMVRHHRPSLHRHNHNFSEASVWSERDRLGPLLFLSSSLKESKEILAKSLATCYLATCYLATCYSASGWRIWWPSFWAVAAATQNTGAGRNKKTLPVLADKGTWH